MKKQAVLLLSTLVLMSVVSMQPANAFKCCGLKKAKPAVTAPVKKEEVKPAAPAVKTVPAVPAKPAAAPAPKAPVKK